MRIGRSRTWMILSLAGVLIATVLSPLITASAAVADVSGQTWRTIELDLTAAASYAAPFTDVAVEATFHGPGGATLTRPAFWDGQSTWKVRFAAPTAGTWTMTTSATNAADTGLNGVTRTLAITPYSGDKAIFDHGFLRASPDGHYLQYADGTPFLYLGDTHWIQPHERFDTSNAPGVASQFKYVVDKRASQGFTVYQSEPIWKPHSDAPHNGPDEEPRADLTNGFSADDLAGFDALDKKFAYVADAGLVQANAIADWVTRPAENPTVYTENYMASLARYWDARYGSYPVIWTIAQEIDKDYYGLYRGTAMAPWTAAIEALDAADAYNQPIMPHLENADSTNSANSRFGSEPWHDGWAAQMQWQDGWDPGTLKAFWDTGKPSVAYETPYEDFWTDSRHALSAFYKSYLTGMRGYGYGISGIWNDIYSKPDEPLDAGTDYQLLDGSGGTTSLYKWWYDAANAPTGDQLGLGVKFFGAIDWWKLEPRFGDAAWSTFGASGTSYLASDGNDTYVALIADGTSGSGTIKKLDPSSFYSAAWFDPRTGVYKAIDDRVEAPYGTWDAPAKPTTDDWVLVVKKSGPVGSAVFKPIASVASGDYAGRLEVSLTAPTPRSAIRYTTDGSTPTARSEKYERPLVLTDTAPVVLKAKAFVNGRAPSGVMTQTYTQTSTNLARNASHTASSGRADDAFDADASTTWRPCDRCRNGQWIQADFGSDVAFNSVLVAGSGGATDSARVQYWDGSDWRTVRKDVGRFGGPGRASWLTFPKVVGSKIRLLFEAGDGRAPVISELGVFDDPDLTVGATYAASSRANPNQAAGKAFDGLESTSWQACARCWNGQWLQAGFGTETTFDTVSLSGSGIGDYRIEYWKDAAWATAYTGTKNGPAKVTFPQVTGTKVRVYVLSGTGEAAVVSELSVFDDPDLTVGGTYSASSQWDENQTADKAFDGDGSTDWQACDGCWDGQWLQVDFGTARTFDSVQVSEYGNRTRDYRIEYWNGSAWVAAYTGTGPFGTTGESATVSFPKVTGTKMRLYFLSGTDNAPIIYELSVYGHQGVTSSGRRGLPAVDTPGGAE